MNKLITNIKCRKRIGVYLWSVLLLAGCTTDLSDYSAAKESNQNQRFDIKNYFSGDLIGRGMVQDYSNKVIRRFCVELNGQWEGNSGVLAEKFFFNDGEITYRNWQLTKTLEGNYLGTAEDVVGIAQGTHQDFVFQFKYDLLLEVEGDTYQVSMDDWMYQIDEHRVVNRTAMSKFKFDVAEVTILFDKQTPFTKCQ